MPPKSPDELAATWLADARSELALASSPLPEGVWPSALCMHAQRAAEKAIKAVYEKQQLNVTPKDRKTHNIKALVDFLNLAAVPPELSNAFHLTKFAVETNYPDDLGEPAAIKESDIAPAVHLAQAVVEWAASIIETQPEA